MAEHRVTDAIVSPPLLSLLTHHPLVSTYDLSAMRMVGAGAAPVTAAQEEAAVDRLGAFVGQGYGMTEAGPLITIAPIAEPHRLRHGTAGTLVPGTEAQIVEGELWVRGPQIFSGYRDDPAATAATLDADGWLHTGDLARIDEAARVTLTGRLKELIKVRAYQVAPAELEAVLTSHPAVADAAVAGVPDERDGERPKAWIVTSGPLDVEELHAYVDERVSPYKRLVAIEVIDELPRSVTGKLLRRVLLERERTEATVSP
jgi:acyl-CoA synthetase (AMP-forming)/AMP-acid ligase II